MTTASQSPFDLNRDAVIVPSILGEIGIPRTNTPPITLVSTTDPAERVQIAPTETDNRYHVRKRATPTDEWTALTEDAPLEDAVMLAADKQEFTVVQPGTANQVMADTPFEAAIDTFRFGPTSAGGILINDFDKFPVLFASTSPLTPDVTYRIRYAGGPTVHEPEKFRLERYVAATDSWRELDTYDGTVQPSVGILEFARTISMPVWTPHNEISFSGFVAEQHKYNAPARQL